ncbi:hypothetical protein FQA39_LY19290 [Lamprigera yunnana]|nr:hypothetical protein FQA39_LY19290 [Lamprigera yunnana]
MKIPGSFDDQHGYFNYRQGLRHFLLDLLCQLACLKKKISCVADSRGFIEPLKREGAWMSLKKRYVQILRGTQTLQMDLQMQICSIGLSAAGILTKEMVKVMAADPSSLQLANPDSRDLPEYALEVRPDVNHWQLGPFRFPNQVNNAALLPVYLSVVR